ncbi:heavy-metal-associated domain-containing protein [Agrococcus sp. ARC_14]|uniref:heavy-metal-associated domain-containing protein n=1 Tax=Agrococcus sp. ARC_14 TaxID=2919927 RepID=UPI001F052231|nr:heavy-metal-associated domain-containing protein [Agrococcus sp. ARC_14]MCH1882850.1 heavy-metal-associated domain-containing protein [Agrococcus sp. ARC_14]
MNTAARLGIYGAGLVLAFGGAFAIAAAVVPDATVAAWSQDDRGAHSDPATSTTAPPATTQEEQEIDVTGVTIAQSGFMIGPIDAPAQPGETSPLSFQILDGDGAPVTAFETAHGKDLHLITVRTDGTGYRHVHPELDPANGTWSLPWTWEAAGSYRVYADFTTTDATSITLSRMIDVVGTVEPQPATDVRLRDDVDSFDVTISGELTAGGASELTVEVARDGDPITDLEPYLGAFGHLVALRQGDLAYLHVHAHGDEPQPGDLAGPDVTFTAEAPTAGRYLLYFDFQVDGMVHTAQFVLDAIPPTGSAGTPDEPAGTDGDAEHDGH